MTLYTDEEPPVDVGVAVGLLLAVAVAVLVGFAVAVAVAVLVGSAVAVAVAVLVGSAVAVAVAVLVGLGVRVGLTLRGTSGACGGAGAALAPAGRGPTRVNSPAAINTTDAITKIFEKLALGLGGTFMQISSSGSKFADRIGVICGSEVLHCN